MTSIPFPLSVEVLRSRYERKTRVDAYSGDRLIATTLFDWRAIVEGRVFSVFSGAKRRQPIATLIPRPSGRLVGYRILEPLGPEIGRVVAHAGAWRGDGLELLRPDSTPAGRVSVAGRAKRLLNLTLVGTILELFGRPRASLPKYKVEIDGEEPFTLRPFGFGSRSSHPNADDGGGVVVDRRPSSTTHDGRLGLGIASILMAHHTMTWPDAGIVLTDVIARLAQLWTY